jgi:hypothetical protein
MDTGRTDEARVKTEGVPVLKDVLCYILVYGNRRVVTAHKFFTSCEVENLLLTGSRLVGTRMEERA